MTPFRDNILIVGVLLFLILLGGGVLVWLAPVPDETLTRAQSNLIEISDWIVKSSFGAIMGYTGGRLATRKSNGNSPEQQP